LDSEEVDLGKSKRHAESENKEHVKQESFQSDEGLAEEDSQNSANAEDSESTLTEEAPHGEDSEHAVGASQSDGASAKEADDTILAMTLTIRNKVNGSYVQRPENLSSADKWTVEYALAEVPDQSRARALYEATQKRRWLALHKKKDEDKSDWNNRYLESIKQFSRQGREWRSEQDEIDRAAPIKVLGVRDGKKMDDDCAGVLEKEKEEEKNL